MQIVTEHGSLIKNFGKNEWLVPSQFNQAESYRVKRPAGKRVHWKCSCPDFAQRLRPCKHIWAIRLMNSLGDEPEPVRHVTTVESEVGTVEVTCKRCGGSSVTRYGMNGKKPAYWCKACQKKFVVDDGFKRLRNDPKVVTLALDLYFKGISLRQISDTLHQFFSVKVSHVTVYDWLKKYVSLLNDYAEKLRPAVGTQKWHADEMKVKFSGEWKWLWHVMDRETRYLLVSKVTTSRDFNDAKEVFEAARRIASGEVPSVIVTDGLPSYIEAAKKVYRTGAKRTTRHEREIHLTDQVANNNMVERMNNTVRGRQRPARGLKSADGPLTKGQASYYNLIRPHSALGGKTPAEVAGLRSRKGDNRWQSAISDALKE